ncbi:MAG: molybdopterin-dependent oxidoreductase [Planctomycetota bacterium]
MTQEIRTACNRDCPDTCSIIATVEDGRIVKHKGDPAHGITRGFLCYRGNHYLDRFYSQDRIVHPQRRSGRGWERISWDDALDLVAEKLNRYRNEFGAQSVAYISYSGIKGLVARAMARKFWDHFGGATLLRGGLSVEPAHAAQGLDFGGSCTHAPEDLANSAGFVVWGKNVSVTRVHCWPFITEARKRGARLVVIDPVCCDTADKADLHLALRPGSDAMLAAGIARLLLEQEAVDSEFVKQHCAGYEAYRGSVLSVPMQDVLDATGLPLEEIQNVASLYAATKPLATMIGLGPSYWLQGGASVRLIDALVALSGNIGIPGGGAHTDIHGGAGLDLSLFREPLQSENRMILLPRLGHELLSASDPLIKMGFVAGANPAATCPDTGRVREGLDALDFLVVVDHFMTATAESADLFLPCTTYLEMEDLVTAYGHHWLALTQAVVPPLGQARTDSEIFQALAQRLGFGEALAGEPSEWIDRFLAPLEKHGTTRQALAERPMLDPVAQPIPFMDFRFGTKSGKFEFITEFFPRVVAAPAEKLRLMATKTLKMVNAQINAEDLPDEPMVRAHPETVDAYGLSTGDRVVVESSVGSVSARLAADPEVLRDLLLFNPAAWRGDLQGVNQLRESLVCDMGDGAAMHETWVTLRKA